SWYASHPGVLILDARSKLLRCNWHRCATKRSLQLSPLLLGHFEAALLDMAKAADFFRHLGNCDGVCQIAGSELLQRGLNSSPILHDQGAFRSALGAIPEGIKNRATQAFEKGNQGEDLQH